MKKIISALIWFLLFMTGSVFAAQKLSKVEIIVFSTINSNTLNQELWPPINADSFSAIKAVPLQYGDTATPEAFHVLPSSSWTMNKEENALRANPNDTVLLHLAWLQPRHKSTIHIFGGQAFGSQWEINGWYTMSIIQYVDAKSTFLLTVPAASVTSLSKNHLNNITDDFAYFSASDQRRMKVNEINYLDSPVFGVLIKVSPN